MSAVTIILNNLMPALQPWQPDERGLIVLSVTPDVVVNLAEDETAEVVHFFSAVGYSDSEAAIAVELGDAPTSEGACSVHVAAETGLVMALRTVERRRLDEQVFLKELGGHVNFARALAAALSPTPLHGVQGTATR